MCFKSRKVPAGIVVALSAVVLVLGLLMVMFSINFTNSDFLNDRGDLSDYKNFAFGVLMLFSLMALVAGGFGISLWCVKHRGFAVCFGLLLTIVSFGLIIEGTVVTMVSVFTNSELQQLCDMDIEFESKAANRVAMTMGEKLIKYDKKLSSVSSSTMCSTACPCNSDGVDKTIWTDLDETVLRSFGRTNSKRSSEFTPLVWKRGEGYTTFDECWTALKAKQAEEKASSSSSSKSELKEEAKEALGNAKDKAQETARKVIAFLEKKHKCNGMCKSALFYWTLPLTEGRPTQTCLTYMKQEIGDSLLHMGLISLVCGILTALIMLVQYLLWCKYDN